LPGATPYPIPTGGAPTQTQQAHSGVSPAVRAKLQSKLGSLVQNLFNIQLRLSGLSPQHNPGLNPVLTQSQGPLGDLNLIVLPHSDTNVVIGANAIGTNTTWNAVLQQTKGNVQFGGGVLYSQMGALVRYTSNRGFGLETRVYGLNYPMIDLYGNFRIAPGASIFFGQRDVNHASRRNTAGLEYQF
jgi:hypothetical protein